MENKTDFKFIEELGKIKDPVIFVGLATLLGVKLVSSEPGAPSKNSGKVTVGFAARDFNDILKDVIIKFHALGRKKRREVLKVLEKANKDQNGSDTDWLKSLSGVDGADPKNSKEVDQNTNNSEDSTETVTNKDVS